MDIAAVNRWEHDMPPLNWLLQELDHLLHKAIIQSQYLSFAPFRCNSVSCYIYIIKSIVLKHVSVLTMICLRRLLISASTIPMILICGSVASIDIN